MDATTGSHSRAKDSGPGDVPTGLGRHLWCPKLKLVRESSWRNASATGVTVQDLRIDQSQTWKGLNVDRPQKGKASICTSPQYGEALNMERPQHAEALNLERPSVISLNTQRPSTCRGLQYAVAFSVHRL